MSLFSSLSSRALICAIFFTIAAAIPTKYKLNQHNQFETDLVPVSSTVIPLPIYQIHSKLQVGVDEEKVMKPVGDIPLITLSNFKKKQVKVADPFIIKEETKEKE